jgi:hypothetical protein
MATAANTVPTPAKKEVVLKAISHPPPFEGNATGYSAFPGLGILSRLYSLVQWNDLRVALIVRHRVLKMIKS